MTIQYNILLVDRSGSMKDKESDTVGGINSYINELQLNKNINDTIYITIIWFDHEQIIYCDKILINDFKQLSITDFKPRGQTALLDAIGDTINKSIEFIKNNPNENNSFIINIATDGLENCSKNYNKSSIKKLIEKAKNDYDIIVIFMAANQDAILEAESMGILRGQAINYDETSNNTKEVYTSAARLAHRSRTGGISNFIEAERQASQPLKTSLSPSNINNQAQNNEITTHKRFTPRELNFSTCSDFTNLSLNSSRPPSPVFPKKQFNQTEYNTPDIWKQHIFLDAAKSHNWSAVIGLINETPTLINVVGGHLNRWTALHHAVHENNVSMILYLLDKGADKNIRNNDGKLPIELTIEGEVKKLLEEDNITTPPPLRRIDAVALNY